MSYTTMVEIANNVSLLHRVAAAAAAEGLQTDPLAWAQEHSWLIASQPGWADAWQYAIDTATDDVNPDTGMRPGVINDQMILSAVQALLAA